MPEHTTVVGAAVRTALEQQQDDEIARERTIEEEADAQIQRLRESLIDGRPEIAESILDPEDIPEPLLWRVLIEPVRVKNQTRGGILLPEMVQEAERYLTYTGRVLAMGPLCYKHGRFSADGKPPVACCEVGDIVVYGQHVGQPVVVYAKDGTQVWLKIVNDDEIRARIKNPRSIMTYV